MKKFTLFLLVCTVISSSHALAQLTVAVNSPTICNGSSTTLNATVTGGTAPYNYQWSNGSISDPITVSPTVTTTYTCTVTDFNSNTASGSGIVTVVNSAPGQPGAISGPSAPCAGSCGLMYSVTNVPGVVFNWTVPFGWTITTIFANSVTVCTGTNSGTVQCSMTNICGTGASSSLSVVVNNVPAQPGAITGPINPCTGQSVIYNIPYISGVTYNWTFPPGWAITGGYNTNSITVTVGASSGTIQVTPSNFCGNGTPSTLIVNVNQIPGQPSLITGDDNPCKSKFGLPYTVTNVSGITYSWAVPGTLMTITLGQGTNSISVNTSATTGSGNITVTPSNVCGTGTPSVLPINVVGNIPAQPSAITGNTTICQGSTQIYSVTNVANVDYTWTMPGGWTILSGTGTNTITVSVGATSGNVTVVPGNGCGIGASQSIAVTVSPLPASAGTIYGPASPCVGMSYDYYVTGVPGITYIWSLPSGWTITYGQSTDSITVHVGSSSGSVQVVPSNSCGNGPSSSLIVTLNSVPAQPGSITGNISPCAGICNLVYSVTNVPGVTYSWTVPAGWTITFGQSTSTITVCAGTSGGVVQVTPSNVCGSGTASSLTVTTSAVPASVGTIFGPPAACQQVNNIYYVNNLPGTTYSWTVPSTWVITTGQGTSSITVTAGTGSGNIAVTPSNFCGNGPVSTYAVTGYSGFNITLTNSNPTICPGDSSILTAGGGISYIWSQGLGTGSIKVVYPTTNTTYTITGQGNNGCTASQTTTVFVHPCNNIVPKAGIIYQDLNNNGMHDPGEPPIPNRIVQEDPFPYYFSSDASGFYSAYYASGTYNLWVPNYDTHCSYNPPFQTLTGTTDSTNDFGYYCWAFNDVSIDVYTTSARPGFNTNCYITFENHGNDTVSGVVQLTYDNLLTYVYSSPVFSTHAGNIITWNYTNLYPGEQRMNIAEFTVPVSAVLGDTIFYNGSITPLTSDSVPSNNVTTYGRVITLSFDPNDKVVSAQSLSPQQVLTEPDLYYTIRFQNTGTDTAINIVIRDPLTNNLIIPSLETISASHPYTFHIEMNGTAVWTLNNIMLPDSGADYDGSQGFIKFKIKAKSSLVAGDSINNTAAIYFDLNQPVMTNMAATIVDITSGRAETYTDHELSLIPNPATDQLNIMYTDESALSLQLKIFNLSGQVVYQANNEQFAGRYAKTIDLSDLPEGVYFVQLTTGQTNCLKKLVVIR